MMASLQCVVFRLMFFSGAVMTKLKKYFLLMTFGAGMGLSLNAAALPGCDVCNSFYLECLEGDTMRCQQFVTLRCDWFAGMECAVYGH